jgi:hypothetical protein
MRVSHAGLVEAGIIFFYPVILSLSKDQFGLSRRSIGRGRRVASATLQISSS